MIHPRPIDLRRPHATSLVGHHAAFVPAALVGRVCRGQSGPCRCRPHGFAGFAICGRYCHNGGLICDLAPTAAQNPQRLPSSWVCGGLDANRLFRHGVFFLCQWRGRWHRGAHLLLAAHFGCPFGAALDRRSGQLAAMVWPCDCHDRHPHGHRRASGDWAAAAGRLWFCRIGLSRHNPRDPLGKTLWLVASPGERQFDWL